ncbi:MAG: hypothetical protein GXN91_05845 [Epsilonproteobacteria bacterium]|nr:hypothetical protein [Campylobacterota bacterium]
MDIDFTNPELSKGEKRSLKEKKSSSSKPTSLKSKKFSLKKPSFGKKKSSLKPDSSSEVEKIEEILKTLQKNRKNPPQTKKEGILSKLRFLKFKKKT